MVDRMYSHDPNEAGVCRACHLKLEPWMSSVCPQTEGGKQMDKLIQDVRDSERITAADLAVTINAKD